VLLDSNPLENITNTKRIAAVVLNGHYSSREKLNGLLADVEASVKVRRASWPFLLWQDHHHKNLNELVIIGVSQFC
jgi:hypothetical protein